MVAILRTSSGARMVLCGPIARVHDRVDHAVSNGAHVEILNFDRSKPCRRPRIRCLRRAFG
jgi:hypothetical protein